MQFWQQCGAFYFAARRGHGGGAASIHYGKRDVCQHPALWAVQQPRKPAGCGGNGSGARRFNAHALRAGYGRPLGAGQPPHISGRCPGADKRKHTDVLLGWGGYGNGAGRANGNGVGRCAAAGRKAGKRAYGNGGGRFDTKRCGSTGKCRGQAAVAGRRNSFKRYGNHRSGGKWFFKIAGHTGTIELSLPCAARQHLPKRGGCLFFCPAVC